MGTWAGEGGGHKDGEKWVGMSPGRGGTERIARGGLEGGRNGTNVWAPGFLAWGIQETW